MSTRSEIYFSKLLEIEETIGVHKDKIFPILNILFDPLSTEFQNYNFGTLQIVVDNNPRVSLPKSFIPDCSIHRMNCNTIYPQRFFISNGTTCDNRSKVILSLFTLTFTETGKSYVPCLVTSPNGEEEFLVLPCF